MRRTSILSDCDRSGKAGFAADVCPRTAWNRFEMESIMCVEARRLEAHARRAARRAGLIARKSHKRAGVPNVNNWGQFMLVDHERNLVVAGLNFDVSAEEVVEL